MHELSVMADLMKKIEGISRENGNKKVTRIKVRIGSLANISVDSFKEHFEEVRKYTVAHKAVVIVAKSTDMTSPTAMEVALESVELAQD